MPRSIAMITRRGFSTVLAAEALGATVPRAARADAPPRADNIVFVHGLSADGSCWSPVIGLLQPRGLNVVSVRCRQRLRSCY